METVNIGFGDIVLAGRMVAIVAPTSMSVKRMVQDARDAGRLIDATYKRRTRAVVIRPAIVSGWSAESTM